MVKNPRMLITGGAGFIGANFAHHIANKYPNYQIIIVDNLNQQGRRENLKDIEDKIEFHHFDLIEEEKLKPIFENGIDYVVHFAAETNVDRSIEDPDSFVSSNVLATNILLRLARDNKVQRFHHVSTDEVFTMSVPMRYMVHWKWEHPCLMKIHLMTPEAHIVQQKQRQTT